MAATGLAEARAAITQMRHNDVCDAGLGAALQELLSRFEERSGVDAVLDADTQAAGMADERAETVFRIVEEALNGVERTPTPKRCALPLRWTESQSAEAPALSPDDSARVRVEVADDGVGFDPATHVQATTGLRSPRAGGADPARFEPRSQPGAGTCSFWSSRHKAERSPARARKS